MNKVFSNRVRRSLRAECIRKEQVYHMGQIREEDVQLIPAGPEDAVLIHEMKRDAFLPLYEKYQDHDTSPALEPLEKTERIISQEITDYLLIHFQDKPVGAARIGKVEGGYHIAPVFIIPQYQNMGIAQTALKKIFDRYPECHLWKLETIGQEAGNCHVYEKAGFVRTGEEETVNDRMTLVSYERP